MLREDFLAKKGKYYSENNWIIGNIIVGKELCLTHVLQNHLKTQIVLDQVI